MKITARLAHDKLISTLRAVQPALKKEMRPLVIAAARIAVRKAIEFTPPGESGMSGMEAKKRGENAIRTDALGGRRGELGKTKRSGIFFTANEGVLRKWANKNPGGEVERLFVRKDGTVWATEKRFYKPNASLGDLNAHHARYWKKGRMSSGGTKDRVIGRHVFIDRLVVGKGAMANWLRAKYKNVGIWAAGWMPAALSLRVPSIPAWIKRHAAKGRGAARVIDTPGSVRIVVENKTGFGDLSRIIPPALMAARAAMLAQATHLKQKAVRRAGFSRVNRAA